MTPELLIEDPLEEARTKVSRLLSNGGGLRAALLVICSLCLLVVF